MTEGTPSSGLAREDTLLQIRLITEGVRYEVKGQAKWQGGNDVWVADPVIVPDWTGQPAMTWPNPHSSLKLVIDGDDVIVFEMDQVVGTAKLEQKPAWRNAMLSDGTTVDSAFLGTHNYESNISIIGSCHASDLGRRCKFCGLIPPQAGTGHPSFDEALEAAGRPVEATIVAIQNGWRGGILFVGGGALPERRDQWTTDVLEALMARFHMSLDDDALSQVSFRTSVYPPNDMGQIEKRKRLGMNACEFDSQVMDPAYFKAVCPGRGDQKHWFEAQEVGVEVFGPGNSMGAIVAGIEPMAGMLEGIEERASKGVLIYPMIFRPFEDAEMRGMRAPSAEWYMEAMEKINEIYLRHGLPPIGYF